MNGLLLVNLVGGVIELQNDSKDLWGLIWPNREIILPMCFITGGQIFPENDTQSLLQHLEMHTYSKHFLSLSVPQMCFGNRNVLRTLSKVSNPLLVSQRDWVSADGAAFHTQPACTSPSCYRFPWHLERWHDKGVAEARRHRLHSHSITNTSYCVSSKLIWERWRSDGVTIFLVWIERKSEQKEKEKRPRLLRASEATGLQNVFAEIPHWKFQRNKIFRQNISLWDLQTSQSKIQRAHCTAYSKMQV